MRRITVKHPGECCKCHAVIEVGQDAVYERHVGIFCPGCAPTDPEEIRGYRQAAANRKADRYEGWAAKRRADAEATIQHNRHYTDDFAFTQPGYIPLRNRVLKQNDRASQSLNIAARMEQKAQSLRHVQVAGDREKQRQAKRDHIKTIIKVGMMVDTVVFGVGEVVKINQKTAKISSNGSFFNVDLSFLKPLPEKGE